MIKVHNVIFYVENTQGQQVLGLETAGIADILLNAHNRGQIAPDGWLRLQLSDSLTIRIKASHVGDISLWMHTAQEMQKGLGKLFATTMAQEKVKFALLRQDSPKGRFQRFVTKCLKVNARLI